MVTLSVISFRDEAVAEQAGGLLAQPPLVIPRPERGKFAADKTRAHADDGIVPRNHVAPDEMQQPGGRERER
jgi:hypothetical protein